MSSQPPLPYRALSWLAALTAFGIVYGSLLPFEYRSFPLDLAVARFKHLTWQDVGEAGRADLVANLVLYVPFGFFTCAVLGRRTLLGGAILTGLLGIALAVCVEFAQIWASPRTVSLNDMITESSGTVIGLAVWAFWGKTVVQSAQITLAGGRQAMHAALGLYVLAYLLVALFPFDFLVSVNEIVARLDQPKVFAWAPAGFFTVRGMLGLSVRIAAMIPLGAVVKLVWRRSLTTGVIVATYFAAVIEMVHWFEVSNKVTFSNIVVAGLGAALGHRFADSLAARRLHVLPWLQSGTSLLALAYFAALAVVRGWRVRFASETQIEQTLASVNWWPFYYHYFVSEGTALASAVRVAASFLPVGALRWAIQLQTGNTATQHNPVWPSVVAAALLSVVLEIGVLVTANLRPDPTNVLIAMAAAMSGQRFCEWVARIVQDMLHSGSRVR